MAQLHEGMLHHALQTLRSRGNAGAKRETLQWIFAPATLVAVRRDDAGRLCETVLSQEGTPFSFERCCRICGYCPQRLRDALAPLLHQLGLGPALAAASRAADTAAATRPGAATSHHPPRPGAPPQALHQTAHKEAFP